MVATDLDGTLLRDDKSISPDDVRTLLRLGKHGVVRVIATGRNLQKVRDVITPEMYFDYVVFSSGAGIYDCRRRELLYSANISEAVANRLIEELRQLRQSFFVFAKVPHNHLCYCHLGEMPCAETIRYYELHRDVAQQLPDVGVGSSICQFLLIFEYLSDFEAINNHIKTLNHELKVLRASSPYLSSNAWMEIFHPDVSKGRAVSRLCRALHVDRQLTLGIGNDYNDIDLLNVTGYSHIAANCPDDLRSKFLAAPDNQHSAFSWCVSRYV